MTGLRMLLVEDDGLVAMTVEDLLEDLGCEVVFSAGSVASALGWLEAGGEVDGALLDVNLGGEMVFPVAEALAARGAPFAFATGYGDVPDGRFAGVPVVSKPIRRAQLEAVLAGFRTAS
jgi:CheY-like chemotaxis protein